MINFLKSLWQKFKATKIYIKLLICTLIALYIGIICICTIKVDVSATRPGLVTNVNTVVNVESDYEKGYIFTVSVYSPYRMSLLEYWFTKMDKNSAVTLGKSSTLDAFTTTEERTANAAMKKQSLQDALILAYDTAKDEGYNVNLDYSYIGEYLFHIPQNLLKTSPSDVMNDDIITKIGNLELQSSEDYYIALEEICEKIIINGKTLTERYKDYEYSFTKNPNDKETIKTNISAMLAAIETSDANQAVFTVKRRDTTITITPSLKMIAYLYTKIIKSEMYYWHEMTNSFSYFEIDYENATPKCNIGTVDSIGPSGGLMQTLAIYNAITPDDITKGLIIMGTGGIASDGTATKIGGEEQKVVTANINGADIFFVPNVNYEDAKKQYDLIKKPTLVLVGVDNFYEAMQYLKNYGG